LGVLPPVWQQQQPSRLSARGGRQPPRQSASRRCMRALAGAAQGHSGWVLCVAWSPDAAVLATGGMDASLWLWDPRTGQALGSCKGAHPAPSPC